MVRRVTAASGVPRSSVTKALPEKQVNESHGFEVSPISQKKMSKFASKAFVNNFTVEVASEIKKRKNVESTNTPRKSQCFDVSVLDLQPSGDAEANGVKENGNVHTNVPSEGKTKNKNKKSIKIQKSDVPVQVSMCNGEMPSVNGQKQSLKGENLFDAQNVLEKIDKQSIQTTSDEATQDINTKLTDNVPSENKGLVINFSESKKKKGLGIVTPQKKSPWDVPLKEGEYEVFVKSKKQVKKTKEKKISPIKVSCIHSCC